MKCAIGASARSPRTFAALAAVAAAGLVGASAEAQTLEPLPAPPLPPSYLVGAPPTSGAAPSDPSGMPPPAPPDAAGSDPSSAPPSGPPGAPSPVPPGGAPAAVPGSPPGAPAQPPAPAKAPSELRFEPNDPDVGLLNRTGAVPVGPAGWDYYERRYAPLYSPVCEGPCTTRVAPGAYRFALVKGGRVVPASEAVVLAGPANLRGQYVDRSGLRAAGLAIGIVGAVGGFVMIVASARSSEVCDASGFCTFNETADGPLLGAGIAVLLGSAILGSILTFQRDAAHITVEPLSLPSARGPREAPLLALGTSQPRSGHRASLLSQAKQGAAIGLHF